MPTYIELEKVFIPLPQALEIDWSIVESFYRAGACSYNFYQVINHYVKVTNYDRWITLWLEHFPEYSPRYYCASKEDFITFRKILTVICLQYGKG